MNLLCSIFAAIVVGTWNGDWFPSGRAEHRKDPQAEVTTIREAAKMLAGGLAAVDPAGTNDVVLCLNEIRRDAATNLVARIGRTNLTVAVITGYRRRDRFDQQQDVIATTLPLVSAGWQKFRNHGKETPPRGYAYANLVFANATTGVVYATHLKSNYGAGKNKDAQALNRAKRTHAVEQILACANDAKLGKGGPAVIGGDMNADRWKKEFKGEKIFALFDAAGFLDLLGLLPPDGRGTHPSAKWGDSALDYVFTRGFRSVAAPRIVPSEALSDHNAFFALVELEPDR